MARRSWSGRRAQRALKFVLTTMGNTCGICGHPGATTLGHITPASIRPDLEWNPDNWRPEHGPKAGNPKGCAHPGCDCPGNYGQGNRPTTPTSTRDW